MISYAQNAEDVLIQRFFASDEPQTYVDVGAAHPILHSVTRHFYTSGWRGINLEPRPDLLALLNVDRPEDINLGTAVSSEPGELTFFEVHVAADTSDDNGGLSTLDRELAEDYRGRGFDVTEYQVEVQTLDAILQAQDVTDIGFLKVDVEGFEAQVMEGLDLSKWRPRLVVLESTLPLSTELADPQAKERLEAHDYKLAFFDGINQFFVRAEDQDRLKILATPANALDAYVPFAQVELSNQIHFLQEELSRLKAQLETE